MAGSQTHEQKTHSRRIRRALVTFIRRFRFRRQNSKSEVQPGAEEGPTAGTVERNQRSELAPTALQLPLSPYNRPYASAYEPNTQPGTILPPTPILVIENPRSERPPGAAPNSTSRRQPAVVRRRGPIIHFVYTSLPAPPTWDYSATYDDDVEEEDAVSDASLLR